MEVEVGDRLRDGVPGVAELRDPLVLGQHCRAKRLARRRSAFARGPLVHRDEHVDRFRDPISSASCRSALTFTARSTTERRRFDWFEFKLIVRILAANKNCVYDLRTGFLEPADLRI